MGMVFLYRLRVPPISQVVEHHLDNLNVGVIHPRTSVFIKANMRNGVRLCYHGTTLPESGRESRPHRTCAAHLRWRDGRRRQGILRACRPRRKGVVCHHDREADGQSGSGDFAACRTGSTGTTYDAARGGCPPNEGDGPQLAGEPGGKTPITDVLRGAVRLPPDFDGRAVLTEELQKKHGRQA